MLKVQHTLTEFFQAPAPAPAPRWRGWLETWNFFVRDAPFRRGVASALADNRPDRLKLWLKLGARPNMRLAMGASPLDTLLVVAVETRSLECVRVLLEAGADVSLASGPGQPTPLCLAASKFGPIRPLCELLVSYGAQWREFKLEGRESTLALSALRLAMTGTGDMSWALESARAQDARRRAVELDGVLASPPSLAPESRPRL